MLNSASAAAFISDRSVGAACQGLPAATARKEKNGLHRAPLLKSTLGQSREEGPEEGPEEGAVTRRGARSLAEQVTLKGENDAAARGRPWTRLGEARSGGGAQGGGWDPGAEATDGCLVLFPQFGSPIRLLQVRELLGRLPERPLRAARRPGPPCRSAPPHKNALPSATVTVAVTGTLNPTPEQPAGPLSPSLTHTRPQAPQGRRCG